MSVEIKTSHVAWLASAVVGDFGGNAELAAKVAAYDGDAKTTTADDFERLLSARGLPNAARRAVETGAAAYQAAETAYFNVFRACAATAKAKRDKVEGIFTWGGLGLSAVGGLVCALSWATPLGWAALAVAGFGLLCAALGGYPARAVERAKFKSESERVGLEALRLRAVAAHEALRQATVAAVKAAPKATAAPPQPKAPGSVVCALMPSLCRP